MKNIAIFASGNGSNAEEIIRYFQKRADICVALVLSNNQDAKVLERAKNLNVETVTFSRHNFYNATEVSQILTRHNIDLIVLAGFLWLVPGYLLRHYQNRIVNIHPALLPNYGGKGMYGMRVHESVIKNGDAKSGITIHFVDEVYDNGEIVFQAKCAVEPRETAESLAQKIHVLEHRFYPETIEKILLSIQNQ